MIKVIKRDGREKGFEFDRIETAVNNAYLEVYGDKVESFVHEIGDILNMIFKDIFPTILQSPINAGAFVMLAGMILVPVVSLLTRKPDKVTTENAFACLDHDDTLAEKAFANLEATES